MPKPRRFVINGKFLRAEQTGVHRVAGELAIALSKLGDEGHPDLAEITFELWHPGNGTRQAAMLGLPHRTVRPLAGILWEQLVLAIVPWRSTLLSLCNIGPMFRRNGVTMIHDIQVHISPQSYNPMFRYWYRLVQPLLAHRNLRILTVSEFSRRKIAEAGLCPLNSIGVVHNGVDHMLRIRADAIIVQRLQLTSRRYVVALSSVQRHKNIAVLLEAFADPRLADTTLVLVGSTTAADFEARGQHLPDNVLFCGRVSDGELRGLMEDALCLAFPSTTEGFGLPPLEAMLVGCPAVIAPCGALPEVCGDAAVQVDPNDPAAWAAAINAFLTDPALRHRMALAGRNRAAHFTWRAAALRLVEELKSLPT